MAAAFPFTVSTTGRLLFFSCFMKSPERRRKVVSDWMSLVISSMGLLIYRSTFLGATKILCPGKEDKGPLRSSPEVNILVIDGRGGKEGVRRLMRGQQLMQAILRPQEGTEIQTCKIGRA